VELLARGIPSEREAPFQVWYKGVAVGMYRADFIIGGRLVLEIKSMGKAGRPEKRQLLHYLRTTNMPVGHVQRLERESRESTANPPPNIIPRSGAGHSA
jgi:GxxExxY protein